FRIRLDDSNLHRSFIYILSRFFVSLHLPLVLFFFFFNDTAPTEIYTLSLHDALPISSPSAKAGTRWAPAPSPKSSSSFGISRQGDRKSTRLNSSHGSISYAVFCLKKKKKKKKEQKQNKKTALSYTKE